MKKIAKISAVLAALVLALACFVGCSDDDDDDGPSVATTWEFSEKDDDGTYTETLYFYADSTWKVYVKEIEEGESYGFTAMTGTYKGDTTKDTSEVKVTVTKIAEMLISEDKDNESTKLVDITDEMKKTLTDIVATIKTESGKTTLKLPADVEFGEADVYTKK